MCQTTLFHIITVFFFFFFFFFLRFCRTWTKRYPITSHDKKWSGWCIRLTHSTLVCEVIGFRLVQVRQNLKERKKEKLVGLAARNRLSLSLPLSFSSSSHFISFSKQKSWEQLWKGWWILEPEKFLPRQPERYRVPAYQSTACVTPAILWKKCEDQQRTLAQQRRVREKERERNVGYVGKGWHWREREREREGGGGRKKEQERKTERDRDRERESERERERERKREREREREWDRKRERERERWELLKKQMVSPYSHQKMILEYSLHRLDELRSEWKTVLHSPLATLHGSKDKKRLDQSVNSFPRDPEKPKMKQSVLALAIFVGIATITPKRRRRNISFDAAMKNRWKKVPLSWIRLHVPFFLQLRHHF